MKERKGLGYRLTSVIECAGASSGRLPLVEIQGRNRVYIENYSRILEYSRDAITILASGDRIRLEGRNLSFLMVKGDSLLITGALCSLTFSEEGKA